jgi:hypothetical protein
MHLPAEIAQPLSARKAASQLIRRKQAHPSASRLRRCWRRGPRRHGVFVCERRKAQVLPDPEYYLLSVRSPEIAQSPVANISARCQATPFHGFLLQNSAHKEGALMDILVSLAKLGAIGASLAFLYLSFQLLRDEQALKDKNGNPTPPRPLFLIAIANFRRAALTFLIVGAVLEFFLSQGPQVLAAVNQSILKNDLVRVRFADWEFTPESKKIAFSFEENRADTAGYLPPAIKNKYAVYVGIRKKDATAPGQGQYDLMLGPYPISNQNHLEKVLSDSELSALGTSCVQFTAFGILKSENDAADFTKPFMPAASPNRVTVFNSATACLVQ